MGFFYGRGTSVNVFSRFPRNRNLFNGVAPPFPRAFICNFEERDLSRDRARRIQSSLLERSFSQREGPFLGAETKLSEREVETGRRVGPARTVSARGIHPE